MMTVVPRDGRRYSIPDEVRAAIRAHGLLRVEDVRIAVLETDGSIGVIPREAAADGTAQTTNQAPGADRTN